MKQLQRNERLNELAREKNESPRMAPSLDEEVFRFFVMITVIDCDCFGTFLCSISFFLNERELIDSR